MRIQYSSYLFLKKINESVKHRDTLWAISCNICQNERNVNYTYIYGVLKGFKKRNRINATL